MIARASRPGGVFHGTIKVCQKEEKKMQLTHFGALFAMIELEMLSLADGYTRKDLLDAQSSGNFDRLIDCFSTATIGRDNLSSLLYAICHEEN